MQNFIETVKKKHQTNLFGELFLAQFIQSEEFLGQVDISDKTTGSKLDTDNDLSVRYHHRYCAEHDLQIFRQLLAPGIAWVLFKQSENYYHLLYQKNK